MGAIVFFFLFAASVILDTSTSIPSETSFLVLLVMMFVFPFRTVSIVALVIGAMLDLFSPVKGLSLLSYLSGIWVCYFLSRHLLTNRSFAAFFILGLTGWIVVACIKFLIFFAVVFMTNHAALSTLFSIQTGWRFARAFGVTVVVLLSLYPLIPESQGIKHAGKTNFLSFGRSI